MSLTQSKGGKVYVTYVDQWLDTLPAADSEDFREFAEITPSIIEIWVYSGILGYPGSFNDLSRWVKMKYKKLDRRGILNSEIAALHSDIGELRMAILSGEIKGDNGAARLRAWKKSYVATLKSPSGSIKVLTNGVSCWRGRTELCENLPLSLRTTPSFQSLLKML